MSCILIPLICFQSVIVKSIERNASSMYEARRRLLGSAAAGERFPVSTSPHGLPGMEGDIPPRSHSDLGLGGLGKVGICKKL